MVSFRIFEWSYSFFSGHVDIPVLDVKLQGNIKLQLHVWELHKTHDTALILSACFLGFIVSILAGFQAKNIF